MSQNILHLETAFFIEKMLFTDFENENILYIMY